MEFSHDSSLYDLLDISPDASPQEIRAAYVRAKATFQKDSLAIYSLMDPAEAQDMIQRIERAYQILSHPDRRRAYDRDFLSNPNAEQDSRSAAPMAFGSTRDKVVSIDRVPPMESSLDDELLVPPTTDYQPGTQRPTEATASQPGNDPFATASAAVETPPMSAHIERAEQPRRPREGPLKPSGGAFIDLEQIEEWSGEQIRRVREARDFPMERLVEITRIRRSYLNALEMDEFGKLPAPVFVRGFLQQIARELKIPPDRLVPSYLERLEKWTQSRKSR